MSSSCNRRVMSLLVVSFLLVASIVVALALSPNVAVGDEAQTSAEPFAPTPVQTKEFLESDGAEPLPMKSETDLHAAQTMPHTQLDRGEALELVEAVFEPELEAADGIYGELEPERFLSNYAAVVPASSLPEAPGSRGEGPVEEHPDQPVLVESMLPLRTEGSSGQEEAVDLELESSEGELQPANPLAEVGIPKELGEEVLLSGPEVSIAVGGAPQAIPATNVEGGFAFYPEVAEDTDLIAAPTPQGVELMADLRSAEAPTQTTYELSLPSAAEVRPTKEGGAEVVEGARTTLVVPPPTAVDAAGDPVRTEMQVSGSSLVVSVDPSPSSAYPILVDPILEEAWHWTTGGSGLEAWNWSTTNSSAYNPIRYARWTEPVDYPGLDLSSGFWGGSATPGTNAAWGYWVPRYESDISRYGSPPTSSILWMGIEGIAFLPWGNYANYPALVVGLIQPGVGWAGYGAFVHYGGEGEVNDGGYTHLFSYFEPNRPSYPELKGFGMDLITYEAESPAKARDTYIGNAWSMIYGGDAPKVLSLTAPSGWVTGATASIGYEFEDTGLGVRRAGVRPEGATGFQTGAGAEFACTGTVASPCPRKPLSTEAGMPKLTFLPSAMQTGRDNLEVEVGDPLWVPGQASADSAKGVVEVKVDNTRPAISLSGPLTEQQTVGTTLAEYPLNVAVTDGEDGAPQSGVASVEVKVDGKKVTMANETPWHPACSTQNCSLTGSWTLKASEYALGTHEVEVIATDAVGQVRTRSWEVELGQEPLQTSFTSPHPTYEDHEIPTISFAGTREGKPVEGVTFKCSWTSETPTTPCTSPYKVPANLKPAEWHNLVVAAVDKEGKADPTPARWHFQTGYYPPVPAPASSSEKLVYPEVGKKTASWYTLEAEWESNPEAAAGQVVTGVTFEVKLPKWNEKEPVFEPVPVECVIDGQGHQVSWPLNVRRLPGQSRPVYLKVRGCPLFEEAGYPEKEIQFRAVFDGGEKVAGASDPAATEFVNNKNATRVSTDATETVGPASVDLLTGAFTMSRTDVSIPVPGYESNLEFTRTYNSSQDTNLPGYSKAMGGAWQPSSPLESEFEGQAWTRIEEQIIPKKEAVPGYACWNPEEEPVECHVAESGCPKTSCEEWIEEPAQPEEKWIELFDNEGNGIPFEIVNGKYVAPDWAKELKLTLEGTNFVLGFPNGTQTVFARDGAGAHDWLPNQISFQANAQSTRLVYVPEGKSLRLEKEIAPAPVECPNNLSTERPGCRTLIFYYTETSLGKALSYISYYGPSGIPAEGRSVAQYTYKEISGVEGRRENVLTAERDPRLESLTENYSYSEGTGTGLLTSVTPPGQEAWNFGYEFGSSTRPSRLKTVSRAGATTTIAYGVPVSGPGAPYAMSPGSIATWGQTDLPVDATAIFPPTHVPAGYPPTDYTGATIHYMDPDGYQVNVASPSPPGISGASIATSETDIHGDVVRELDPQNRLYALEASNTVARSHELDSHSVYNAAGTEQLESWGPLHWVRPASGEGVEARQHTVTHYDEEEPTPKAGTPWAFLPTKETVGLVVPGKEGEFEAKTTETKYRWDLRKPKETIVDPEGLHIRSVTEYNAAGQVTETRQPKNAGGGGAGTTQTIYYSAGEGGECVSKQYANLPCKVLPAAQAEGAGRPKLLVKRFTKYDNLDEPEVIKESAGGEGEERITTITYGAAGRQLATKITGGGVEVPKTETEYSATLGVATGQHFVCEGECGPAGRFETAIGEAGTGNGKFNHPADVAFDSKGNMWVLDRGNNRIEEFNEKGEFQRSAGSEGSTGGKLKSPSALAVDPSNNIWVADTANNRIEEFNEKGEFVAAIGKDVNKTKVEASGTEAERNYCSAASGNVCQAGPEGTAAGQLKAPQGIAASSSGNIWVADTGHSRMEKYSPTGAVLNNSFGEGTEPGRLKEPTAVVIAPNGSIWVADTGNNRIQHWLSTELGKPAGVFGTEGSGNGQFKHPDALEVAAGGKVWVGDEGNGRVEEFEESGTFLGKFGSAGAGSGQFSFSAPIGLATDSEGNVWVSDPGHNKIQEWAPINAFDTQATTTEYNKLGQVTKYEDADGNETKTTYDAYGRPVTTSDKRGSSTVTYDPATSLPTKLEVSGIGTFTARYDADGDLVETTMPNGLSRKTTYNAAGEPVGLSYTKTSYCGTRCTWFDETLERGAEGRIFADTNSLANDRYTYDKDGRLTEARETPAGKSCTTTRTYAFEGTAGLDSNRTKMTTAVTGIGETCAKPTVPVQNYSYDAADRLEGPTYDPFGRITSLPAEFAGGKALNTTYYNTGMVATQSQGTITNSFELDAMGRQRARLQAGGGLEGTEVFHYDGPSDSVAWTQRGTSWTRSIAGIGGELVAMQEAGGVTFQLTDLHGDVVATAEPSPTATALKGTFRFDEFGNPVMGSAGRFGWLGGKHRRTELLSSVIQMGARSYIPSLGRFLTPDPVRGGSANAYDYANQDPVNNFDLNGEKLCINVGRPNEVCGAKARELKRAASRLRKTGKLRLVFTSKQIARRFLTYLSVHNGFFQNAITHRENLKAAELDALEQKIERITTEEAIFDPKPSMEWCRIASGASLLTLGAGPATGWFGYAIGVVTTVGSYASC